MAALAQPATRCGALTGRRVGQLVPQHCAVHGARVAVAAPCRGSILVARAKARASQPASKPAERFPSPLTYKLWPTELSIGKDLYNAVIVGECLFYAALADAAFSGDWSRIGVLTTDQELLAQGACKFIFAAHTVVAALSVRIALQGGYPPITAALKGLLFGTLGLYDVHLRCVADAERQ